MKVTKASEYDGKHLRVFLDKYNYQPKLKEYSENIREKRSFDELDILKIILWKVNRYADIKPEIVQKLNQLKKLEKGQHKEAKKLLEVLLEVDGVDLPMASTLLRFRNPSVFQIIDRHSYRAVYGKKYPLYSTSPKDKKIAIYFEYIDVLIELCKEKKLVFETIDRCLYVFDKEVNKSLKVTSS